MSESNSGVAIWTAIAALVLSLSSAGYAMYRAARGPDLVAFRIEDIFLFAYPGDGGDLGAVAKFELANKSPDYPDMLDSQAVRVLRNGESLACLSERGEAKLSRVAPPPPPAAALTAAPAPGAAPPPAAPAESEPNMPVYVLAEEEVTEVIGLQGWDIGVLDAPSRAELNAGALLSRRQLFDQRASRSGVDPCADPEGRRYPVSQLVKDFKVGDIVELRYEARFVESPSLTITCTVRLNESRANLLSTRGYINAPCDDSIVGEIDEGGPLSGVFRFFGRIF